MAIRRWAVRPDETGQVSREAMQLAFMDAEAMLHVAGGVIEVVVQRVDTGVPGEKVTTAALFSWKDRTDAKPQPEQQGGSLPQPTTPRPEPSFADVGPGLGDGLGDGLDEASLPDEDLEAVPEPLR